MKKMLFLVIALLVAITGCDKRQNANLNPNITTSKVNLEPKKDGEWRGPSNVTPFESLGAVSLRNKINKETHIDEVVQCQEANRVFSADTLTRVKVPTNPNILFCRSVGKGGTLGFHLLVVNEKGKILSYKGPMEPKAEGETITSKALKASPTSGN